MINKETNKVLIDLLKSNTSQNIILPIKNLIGFQKKTSQLESEDVFSEEKEVVGVFEVTAESKGIKDYRIKEMSFRHFRSIPIAKDGVYGLRFTDHEGEPVYVLLSSDKLTVKNGDVIWWRYAPGGMSATSFTTQTQIDLSTLETDVYYRMKISSRILYIYVVNQDNSKSGTACSYTSKTIVLWAKGLSVTRWERSRDGGGTWTNIACTSYQYTESSPSAGTAKYRVLATDNTYSDVVTITYVDAVPSIIQALPATSTKTVDESITLEADVEDQGYSYQWYKWCYYRAP